MVPEGDEGRCRLRYAPVSRQTGKDPKISEWGNPCKLILAHPLPNIYAEEANVAN